MNAGQYTPNLVASHVNAGTALPRDPDDGVPSRHPKMRTPKLHTELDDRLPATCFGGVSLFLSLWRQLKVSDAIDLRVDVLRRHKPYHESDHVLAQVLNLFVGGTCIEDQATLQLDRAVLRMLGTERFPDPTTSGDFLRRFDERTNRGSLDGLRSAGDAAQTTAWATLRKRQPRRRAKLGHWGLVDMDSHIAAFTAEQKEGADFGYTGRWCYHPLLLSLANSNEILAVRNRPGNATSAEGVEDLLEAHLPRVAENFEDVLVRGDSAFDRASIRATCARHGARFALVARRRRGWTALAQGVPENEWTPWVPPARALRDERRTAPSFQPRRKGTNHRRARALSRFYVTKWKDGQWVSEVACRPTVAEAPCRLIIVRELIKETWSPTQPCLFQSYGYRYVVTDLPASFTASEVVGLTYQRCDQENIIEQLKNELVMWRMPVREAAGNAAWIEIARLAWNLGKWLSLLALPLETLRWEWKRLRQAFVYVAAEVLLRARQTWVRFNPSHRHVPVLIEAHARLGP